MKQRRILIVLTLFLVTTLGSLIIPSSMSHANLVDGWEYFWDLSNDNHGIYKRNVETNEIIKLNDDFVYAQQFLVHDGWIYYSVMTDPDFYGSSGLFPAHIMKMKLDGSQQALVSEAKSYSMDILGDWIIFAYHNPGDDYIDGQLFKMNFDGSELIPFAEYSTYQHQIVGDWIYFLNNDDLLLYRLHADGTPFQKITDESIDLMFGSFEVIDDVIGYGSLTWYKLINVDGTNKIHLADNEATLTQVTEEWIYFNEYINYDEVVSYKIKRDGTNKTLASEDENMASNDVNVPEESEELSKEDSSFNFQDIASHWAENDIHWALENNIVTGYPDGTFQPNKSVTEEEFLKMFLVSYGIDDTLGDQAKRWSDSFYHFADANNYPVKGLLSLEDKSKPISRLTVAEIIAKADGVDVKGDEAILYLLEKGYSKGKTAPTVEGYAGYDHLTRAEAIKFIKNLLENGLNSIQ